MRKKRWILLTVGFLMVCFLSGYAVFYAQAQENEPRVLKVGWFTIDGYQFVDEDGNRSGYGFEYYQEIGKYLECRYEYITGTWNECLEWLKEGKIDVLSFVQYTEERDQYFDYTEGSIGQNYAVLTAKTDNPEITGTTRDIEGSSIGALKGASQINQFKKWALENGINNYSILEFDEVDGLLQSLKTGEIDLVLHNSFRVMEDFETVVAKFSPERLYLAVQEGNQELKSLLDEALAEIQMDNPYFAADLTQRYYASNTSKVLVLNEEEQAFLKSQPVLNVVSAPERYPFSYVEDGQIHGINVEIVESMAERLGIKCRFLQTDSYEESIRMVQEGEADLICGYYYDYSWAEENHVRLTNPYLKMQYCMVSRKNADPGGKDSVVAAAKGLRFSSDYVMKLYPGERIVWYDSVDDCIRAVNEGKADMTFFSTYTAEHYLKDYQYANLTSSLINYTHDVTLAVSDRLPAELAYLIGKALVSLGSGRIDTIVSEYMAFRPEDIGWLHIFYINPVATSLVIFSVGLLLVILLVIIVHTKTQYGRKLIHIINTDRVTDGMSYEKFRKEAQNCLDKNDWKGFALIYLDLQNFKYVNDTFGHQSGDALLKTISRLLLEMIHKDELAARVYADHFVLLLHSEDTAAGEEKLIGRLREFWRNLGERTDFNQYSTFFKSGVYQIHKKYNSIDRAADAAIYALHTPGTVSENTVVYYNDSMREKINTEKEIERDMNLALERREYVAFYQPKVDVVTKQIVGAEALVRWRHPVKGMIPPGDFIPFFEKNNFITKLDVFMFEEVCRDQRRLMDMGFQPLPISVNFSRRHLRRPDWVKQLNEITERYEVSKGLFELEITETVAEENFDMVQKTIEELRSCGFKISIDDFGSGYSSVQLLYRIPIDVLKLDKSYFHDTEIAKIEREVILSVIHVANENGIQVIWEGVETPEQERTVMEYGCRYAQGFLYARPMVFEDYVKRLREK